MVRCEGKGVIHAALYHAEDHRHVWHEVCYCSTIVACFASILYQNHLSYVKDLLRATHLTVRPSYLVQIPSLLSPRPHDLSPNPPLCPCLNHPRTPAMPPGPHHPLRPSPTCLNSHGHVPTAYLQPLHITMTILTCHDAIDMSQPLSTCPTPPHQQNV